MRADVGKERTATPHFYSCDSATGKLTTLLDDMAYLNVRCSLPHLII
jgi:hypothetical protein